MLRLSTHRARRGFSLLEILVTLVIFSIIFTLIVPMLLDSLSKAKQKRTVADMRDVGLAWYDWLTDAVSAAAAGTQGTYYFTGQLSTPISAIDLLSTLYRSDEVFYIQTVPEKDAWGTDYEYRWSGHRDYSGVIGIRSFGNDGVVGPSADPYTMGPFDTTHYAEDIIWADGFFVRYPAGIQSQ